MTKGLNDTTAGLISFSGIVALEPLQTYTLREIGPVEAVISILQPVPDFLR